MPIPFHVVYQPRINKDQQVVALEALTRFHGIDDTFDVIKYLFERNEIKDHTTRMCQKIRDDLASLRMNHVACSVNVTIDLLSSLEDVIELIAPACPKIEIEVGCFGEYKKHQDELIDFCKQAKANGVKLVLDGFGDKGIYLFETFSGVVDIIKIDMSMIRLAAQSKNMRKVLEFTVDLAKENNIVPSAKKVENEQDLDLCQIFGFEEYQGFLFCDPSPAHTLVTQMNNNGLKW